MLLSSPQSSLILNCQTSTLELHPPRPPIAPPTPLGISSRKFPALGASLYLDVGMMSMVKDNRYLNHETQWPNTSCFSTGSHKICHNSQVQSSEQDLDLKTQCFVRRDSFCRLCVHSSAKAERCVQNGVAAMLRQLATKAHMGLFVHSRSSLAIREDAYRNTKSTDSLPSNDHNVDRDFILELFPPRAPSSRNPAKSISIPLRVLR